MKRTAAQVWQRGLGGLLAFVANFPVALCRSKFRPGVLQLPAVQQQSDGTLFWKITNGNPDRGMPSFSRLPELQRWQLVLYLRTLKSASAPSHETKK